MNEQIPYPTEAERERSIRHIVAMGVPRRVGLWASLVDVVRSLGVRSLFFGVGDCVFLGLMTAFVAWAPLFAALFGAAGASRMRAGSFADAAASPTAMAQMTMMQERALWIAHHADVLLVAVFLVSPLLHMAISLLMMLREREVRMLDLLRTCRWSFRQIAAIRMLALGAMSTVMCVAFGVAVGVAGLRLDAVTVLGVSFSSLFVFALGQLAVERHCAWPASALVMPAIWLVLGTVLWLTRAAVAPWLAQLPPAVCLAVGLASAAVYLASLNAYCRKPVAIA
ncbi:hypothetical protein KIH77_09130 [Bifidobacterium sp. 82T24]|uniref:ABC transporter permease n=1 Tax=Bifidobacterium saimiriisciurei TaxID=2661627 RepID=A0ABX0CCH5_9BIFI|nr:MULTISPECIES: hypothetical protein [Bifidobacterium]MBW3088882.1 hypothetical protein [Bifidobacterium pluvialisilvae]NEG96266.1 hypothetical protein [Bifidobacterium sp. SMB2]NEH12361.1 hypothetical protein [Bifidobacterium saimiriisciurei]